MRSSSLRFAAAAVVLQLLTSCHSTSTSKTPGCSPTAAPTAPLTPPGAVSAGDPYSIFWKAPEGLLSGGKYEVERSRELSFRKVEKFVTEARFLTFQSGVVGAWHHRLRALQSCGSGPARSPWSPAIEVLVTEGSPQIRFVRRPEVVRIGKDGDLTQIRSELVVENVTSQPLQAIIGKAEIGSPPFFSISDPDGGGAAFVTLQPRQPKRFELRYFKPVTGEAGPFHGMILISAAGLTSSPYAIVTLEVE